MHLEESCESRGDQESTLWVKDCPLMGFYASQHWVPTHSFSSDLSALSPMALDVEWFRSVFSDASDRRGSVSRLHKPVEPCEEMILNNNYGHLVLAHAQKSPLCSMACWQMFLAFQGKKPWFVAVANFCSVNTPTCH